MGGAQDFGEPPAYSSPTSVLGTPAAGKSDSKAVSNGASSAAPNGNQSAIGGGAVSVGAVAATSVEELKAQLQAAQAQIVKLTKQAGDSSGLRQRTVASTSTTSSGSTTEKLEPVVPGGVSVPLSALLCLLSFLIAYLLF